MKQKKLRVRGVDLSHLFTLMVSWCFMLPSARLAAQTQLTNLPTLYITTDDGKDPWSRDIYQSGRLIVKSSDPTEALDMITEIRGRGNSTWSEAKKPYRIKLDKKYNLLNNKAKAKSWVLLANHKDKTLIRNAVAFKISELVGMKFSPSTRFVDVNLNGKYIGNYHLTDQMEVNKNRVPVEEQDSGMITLPEITGGYLIEVDGFAGAPDWWFKTSKGMPVTIHYPDDEDINLKQYTYIRDFTQKFETALFSTTFSDPTLGYRQYVDEASLVNWYIACELTGNPDSFWSTYMYKYYNSDKFFFGPLWDFDIAFNNDSRLGDATYKLMRENAHEPKTWIKQIWKDPWFKRAVNSRWTELVNSGILNKLLTYVDETKTLISASQALNEDKWHKVNGSYTNEINQLKSYLTARVNFLTGSFATDLPPEPSKPFVPEDYYYMLMNVATNNVIETPYYALDDKMLLWMMNAKEEDNTGQRWVFVPIDKSAIYGSEGYYQIINENSGMAIAGNGKNNSLIQVKPNLKDYTQMWQVRPVLTGDIYGVVNFKTGLAMTNKSGNTAAETPVIEYDTHLESNESEQWYLKKMEEITELPGYPAQPSGIDSPKEDDPLFVYYNSATGKIQISVNSDILPSLSVKIYSMDGRCLYSESFKPKHSIEILVSGFLTQAGVYVLNVNGVAEKIVVW